MNFKGPFQLKRLCDSMILTILSQSDVELLDLAQRMAMKTIRGLGQLSYEERLGELGLFSLEEKALGRRHCILPVLERSLQAGRGLTLYMMG